MHRGHELLRGRGFDPEELLLPLDRVIAKHEASFDFIVSEDVLEHVADLPGAAQFLYRITRPGGYGYHEFPGPYWLIEGHLKMPFVHWLPKNSLRKLAIAVALKLGWGPRPMWPEFDQVDFATRVAGFFRYSIDKTFYRSLDRVTSEFEKTGFACEVELFNAGRSWADSLPLWIKRSGFPRFKAILRTARRI